MFSEAPFGAPDTESAEIAPTNSETPAEIKETQPDTDRSTHQELKNIQTGEDPKAKPWPTGKRQLRQAVKLTSNQEWLDWVQSDLVKIPWLELWNNYLRDLPHLKTGVRFNTVMRILEEGEANGRCRYSIDTLNKSQWTKLDHHARFIWKIKDNNIRSSKGVFYESQLSSEEIDLIVWGLKEWLIHVHSPGQIDKPSGGAALFGSGRA